MTFAVAGLWELGHSVPLTEASLWEMIVRDFEVDEWHMAPITGIDEPLVKEWHNAAEMISALRSEMELVFVTENGAAELADFIHPKNACYVFGKCNWSPFLSFGLVTDHKIKIGTPADKALLWPHQCAAVVLYHRRGQWP